MRCDEFIVRQFSDFEFLFLKVFSFCDNIDVKVCGDGKISTENKR